MEALRQVAGWPVGGAAVGVVPVPVATGADPPAGPGRRAGPAATVGDVRWCRPWASVTKPATALAALVAVEEGSLSLDEPAGPPGATVRHLLAHASGLGLDPGPPLAAPGTRRIYSNAGYQVLADRV